MESADARRLRHQPNLTFTVTYTDSTTQTFTQSISDWYTPQNYAGENTVVSTAYRDISSGGTQNVPFNVYGYRQDGAEHHAAY